MLSSQAVSLGVGLLIHWKAERLFLVVVVDDSSLFWSTELKSRSGVAILETCGLFFVIVVGDSSFIWSTELKSRSGVAILDTCGNAIAFYGIVLRIEPCREVTVRLEQWRLMHARKLTVFLGSTSGSDCSFNFRNHIGRVDVPD